MKEYLKIFTNGLVRENPLLITMIGLCSALAVTTSAVNGLGMGLSMTFVLLMSEIVINLFRKVIPDSIRLPVYISIIAAFTTVIDYALKAYFPDLSKAMGVFIPLIVVNCIIMARVEGFASKQTLGKSILDALGMGLGFAWVLTAIGAVREILGNGTILGIQLLPENFQPMLFFILPAGGFFVFALFISLNLFIKSKLNIKVPQVHAGCCGCAANAECPSASTGNLSNNGGVV